MTTKCHLSVSASVCYRSNVAPTEKRTHFTNHFFVNALLFLEKGISTENVHALDWLTKIFFLRLRILIFPIANPMENETEKRVHFSNHFFINALLFLEKGISTENVHALDWLTKIFFLRLRILIFPIANPMENETTKFSLNYNFSYESSNILNMQKMRMMQVAKQDASSVVPARLIFEEKLHQST